MQPVGSAADSGTGGCVVKQLEAVSGGILAMVSVGTGELAMTNQLQFVKAFANLQGGNKVIMKISENLHRLCALSDSHTWKSLSLTFWFSDVSLIIRSWVTIFKDSRNDSID